MKYQLQIVGAATVDTRASVAVVFDAQRYLFNCGEGTQRFLNDRAKTCMAVSGAKTRQLFFTRNAWACIGGLPGMILTLADAGGKGMTVRGPSGLRHSIAAMRQFLYRPTHPVTVYENTSGSMPYSDENLTVTSVILHPSQPARTPDTDAQLQAVQTQQETQSNSNVNSNGKREIYADTNHQPPQLSSPLTSREEIEHSVLSKMFKFVEPAPLSESAATAAKRAKRDSDSPINVGFHPLSSKSEQHHAVSQNDTRRANLKRLTPHTKSTAISAYICKGPKVNGKFDNAAAKALGIPSGPIRGNLSKGMSITLDDGRTIRPQDVCAPSKEGAIFIILDCPSLEYIDSIVSHPQLQANAFESNPVQCIVHLLGPEILQHEAYQKWMNTFGDKTQHIVSSEEHSPLEITLTATAQIQHDLNYLSEPCFPLPFSEAEARLPLNTISGLPKLITAARPLTIYQFEPKRLVDQSAVAPTFKSKRTTHDKDSETFEKYKAEADAVRPSVSFGNPSRPVSDDDVVIVPLGTAAAIPGKYRNVSSTYLRFSDGSMFFDAGEGTLGQLYRHYGRDKLDDELRMVKCIFISHLHADHHLGVVNILKRIHELQTEVSNASPVCVVGPLLYLRWLEEYADVEEFGFEKLLLFDSRDFLWNSRSPQGENEVKFRNFTGITSFETVLVKHCAAAYALVMEKNGIKISFSGDCRPSDEFVQVGRDSTLVIHEATLEDDKMTEAVLKKHCTTSEAIDIATRMNAKNLLLTHFSQRYPKLPLLDASKMSSTAEDGRSLAVGIAFDSMRVRLSEFNQLEPLYGPLNTLWGQTAVKDEDILVEDEKAVSAV
ncbi:beta-lactamase-like protein [Chytriomyces cf. hyalinus JEL632]|nr:beta-lactamase-like protein [Chytriomyces cf. hyalinus JEL632]